jgi:hypothetical protein
MTNQIEKIKSIKNKYEKSWLALEGVVAVGIGKTSDKKFAIIISVKEDIKKLKLQIADNIDGIPIEIQETGDIKAF